MDSEATSTAARLRSTKRKSSPRSIDHGSSDYLANDANGSFGSFSSVSLNNGTRADNSSPSTNTEGLHHRHPHKLLESRGPPSMTHSTSHSKLSIKARQSPRLNFKYAVFPALIFGYVVSYYGMHSFKRQFDVEKVKRDEERHQEERWREMLKDVRQFGGGGRGGGSVHSEARSRKNKPVGVSPFSRRGLNRQSTYSQNKDSNFVSFGFDAKQSVVYEPGSAADGVDEWSRRHVQSAVDSERRRQESRRDRTSGLLLQSSGSVGVNSDNLDLEAIGAIQTDSGLLPLWYELNHLTADTMSSLHRRWKRDDAATINTAFDSDSFKDFNLCGANAQKASQIHPHNYYPSNATTHFDTNHAPLGPSSRVLITGILSPLGMHLAIALSRQCNITNFLGIDTQMPNDPLSRLEQQDRLAVLMEELADLKPLQVPFLGVQSKQRGKKTKRQDGEGKAREEALVQLFLHGEFSTQYANLPKEYQIPNHMYGIPNAPGIHPDGFGPLEILLEFRPTHVVHLANTQSESFTIAKDVDFVLPTQQEEEEVILKESISTKPYLYQLRMGGTGMEQLLSAIVAMGMLPPRYGRDYGESEASEDEVKTLSEDDLNKMKSPHLVYASSYDAGYFGSLARRVNERGSASNEEDSNLNNGERQGNEDLGSLSPLAQAPPRGLNGVFGLIDEVMASTYYALYGLSSVGLRFDAIYGPRGFGVPSTSVPIYNVHRIRRGGVSSDVDLAETAVRRLYRKWVKAVKKKQENEDESAQDAVAETEMEASLIEEAGWLHAAHDPRDFVFVEDAVGAIIAAMQYRPVGDSPATFSIGSGEMSTLASLSTDVEQLLSDDSTDGSGKSVIDVELSSAARSASLDSKEFLQWSATTTMQDGAAKTLSWHLDRALPFFPPSTDGSQPVDGEDILSRRGLTSCTYHSDRSCLRESPIIPCSSECSTKTCAPSIFDGVVELSREVTEGCEAVLYTMSLGYDVKKLHLQTQYSDGQEQKKNNEPSLCTIAFVPTESRLVHNVIAKVPPSSLNNMNLDLSEDSDYETKVKKLSGHLVHQGWLLIFIDGATEPLTAEDVFMPKLSPRRLFHPSVRRAMFVDENFSSTPMPDDALFLTSEMSRGKIKKRTVMGPNEKGKKIKYKLPEEPPRTAVMMIAPMRNLPKADSHQMPLREITKHLLREVGGDENIPEPKEVRVQREFYERARSLINSSDLRSLDDMARHRIQIKDFIRSRWVLHDLKEEEGHQLRCEWYREHVRWNTHLDQLSFAYVMAKRELARKIITEQPLQTEIEKKSLLQMVIDAKSDAKEWHPIFSGEGTTLPIHHLGLTPEAIPQNLQDQHEITEDAPQPTAEDEGNTFYVRIMSDERMVEARKAWSKARQARLHQARGAKISPADRRKIADAVQREKDRH